MAPTAISQARLGFEAAEDAPLDPEVYLQFVLSQHQSRHGTTATDASTADS